MEMWHGNVKPAKKTLLALFVRNVLRKATTKAIKSG
jgi:hypothetical protein